MHVHYIEGCVQILSNTLLSHCTGILDDEEVQATLQQLKEVAINVQKQLDEAQVTEQEITLSRQQYFPVSESTPILYVCTCMHSCI